MSRNRIALLTTVDLDPTPGRMHSKESVLHGLHHILTDRIPSYDPLVSIAPIEVQPDPVGHIRDRSAFLIYVDLDPFPGTFHVDTDARAAVQMILEQNISHYNPEVVLSSIGTTS